MVIVLTPQTAVIVPKSVFASVDEAEQFYTTATGYYTQARQSRPAPA